MLHHVRHDSARVWNQANYPETLHRFYIINTPWVFQGIYKIAEKFLDPVVKSKVRTHCLQ
jgi:hypothetical protein